MCSFSCVPCKDMSHDTSLFLAHPRATSVRLKVTTSVTLFEPELCVCGRSSLPLWIRPRTCYDASSSMKKASLPIYLCAVCDHDSGGPNQVLWEPTLVLREGCMFMTVHLTHTRHIDHLRNRPLYVESVLGRTKVLDKCP